MKYYHTIYLILTLLLLSILPVKSQDNLNKEIVITGTLTDSLFQNMKGVPEIEIKNGEEYFPYNKYAVTFNGNHFKFKFTPKSDIQYFRLHFAPTILSLRSYMILPGDSVHLNIFGFDSVKSKSNSKLFECQFELKKVIRKITFNKNVSMVLQYSSYLQEINNNLLKYKSNFSKSIYELLKINAYNEVSSSFCMAITTPIAVSKENEKNLKEFSKFITNRPVTTCEFLLRNLDRNSEALLYIEKFKNTLPIWDAGYNMPEFKSNRFDLMRLSIKNNYKGLLRDQLLTLLYILQKQDSENTLRYLEKDIILIKDQTCINKLIQMREGTMKGNPAFPFVLENDNGKRYTLDNFTGKVIVAIFYSTGCTPCAQLHSFLSKWKEPLYENKNIVFLNISTDKYREKWLADLKLGLYTSPKETNLWLGETSTGHPMYRFYNYYGLPQMLLIDKEGKIISSNPIRPIDSNTLANFDKLIKNYL